MVFDGVRSESFLQISSIFGIEALETCGFKQRKKLGINLFLQQFPKPIGCQWETTLTTSPIFQLIMACHPPGNKGSKQRAHKHQRTHQLLEMCFMQLDHWLCCFFLGFWPKSATCASHTLWWSPAVFFTIFLPTCNRNKQKDESDGTKKPCCNTLAVFLSDAFKPHFFPLMFSSFCFFL